MSKQFLDYTGLTKFKELSDDHYDEVKNVTWQEYEAIEDKNDDKAYFITDVPPSEQKKTAVKPLPTGSISTVTDAAELPLNALKVSVEAWQEGSGDPSPSNIRPIHGWSSASIYNKSKNLFPMMIDEIKSANTQGTWSGNDYSYGGMIFTLILDAKNSILGIKINGRAEGSYKDFYFIGKTRVNLATYGLVYGNQYTISGSKSGLTVMLNGGNVNIEASESGTTFIATNSDIYFPALRPTSYASFDNVIIYPQIEAGTQVTDFVPYCTTYTQAFIDAQGNPLTIYGAEWDVTNGILKTRPYYASYNGETLVGPWISSMDEYTQGGTPTTGAQVVDMGGIETIINLSPLSIRMLEGTNNLYADCGEVIEGEYFGNNTNQIRVNDNIIAGGNSVTFAVESKYAEHADIADNACTFSVDENGLLTISLVSGDSNNSLSSTRSVKSITTLPPEKEEIKDESVEEEPSENESAEESVEEESGIVEEKTDETEEELSENESEEPSVEKEKDNDNGGEETPPKQNMR